MVWLLVVLLGCVSESRQAAGERRMKIKLISSAFVAGEPIPARYTGVGEDISPPLAWSGAPKGTRELALICDDPDAPSAKHPGPEPWVHWVLYGIPAGTKSLPEAIPRVIKLEQPVGALQGNNSWPAVGYRGPLPPPGSGPHRYFFKLYALDTKLSIGPKQDKQVLLEAISGHVLAEGQLMGTFER